MGKKGEEMVEAAMVFPLLILMMVSVISIAVFLFQEVKIRADMQKNVILESASADRIYGSVSRSGVRSGRSKGMATFMRGSVKTEAHVISQLRILRAKESIFE